MVQAERDLVMPTSNMGITEEARTSFAQKKSLEMIFEARISEDLLLFLTPFLLTRRVYLLAKPLGRIQFSTATIKRLCRLPFYLHILG